MSEGKPKKKGKVVFCTPFLDRLTDQYIASMEASLPVIEAAGWEHQAAAEIGNCYISNARANCLRRALNGEPDMVVFIDYDLSWTPESLLRLIETKGDVIAGTYRFKKEEEEYMARTDSVMDKSIVREDGCVRMIHVPAGFLKITRHAVNKFMLAYPELVYGDPCHPYIDLFSHGAMKWNDPIHGERRTWFGEDYAFAHRWRLISGGDLWCQPNLDIAHHAKDKEGNWHDFPGNFHEFMCKQPGGSKDPARLKAKDRLKLIDSPDIPDDIRNMIKPLIGDIAA